MTDMDSPEIDAVVSLREITAHNLFPVMHLSSTLSDAQQREVESNAVSIAQAHYSKYAWFRAIYADETPVGFLMVYIGPEQDDTGWEGPVTVEPPVAEQPTIYFLWRMMIGGPYQGKGFGRRALEIVMDDLRKRGATEFVVSCGAEEGGPEGFYRRLGFVRNGKMYGGEVGLALKL